MITIDRTSNTPVHEQLVEQIRYLIATGRFKVGERLPSTRALGEQIGLSFHTVRKAYQELEKEGLLESRVGSGYTIRERAPLSKADRMERGASVIQEALQRLIGLGLHENEIEYLFQEQLSLLESERERLKLVFAAPFREMAAQCARQLSRIVQQPVEPVTMDEAARHQDADLIFARLRELRGVLERVPRADAVGVYVYLSPEALRRASLLLDHETLGLVTRHPDAIGPLTAEIRAQTGFSGQIMAASIDEGAGHLDQLLPLTDLVLFTPAARRRLLPYLDEKRPHAELSFRISSESLDAVRQAVPS